MTSKTEKRSTPDWDLEQLEVILEQPSIWQLVIAGPGAGKSAVACQRVAFLIDEGLSAPSIHLISFTRTAIAEIRDRIIAYTIAGERAKAIRISTLDSHAWSLRAGFDDEAFPSSMSDSSYELNIKKTVTLLNKKDPLLLDFISGIRHLIIDEAQDVMGVRADLVLAFLNHLSPDCGVTILADPAQAIYGFTSDSNDYDQSDSSLLERLNKECPRSLIQRSLTNIHRIEGPGLTDIFLKTRKVIETAGQAEGHVVRVKNTIRQACGNDIGITTYENLADFLSVPRDGSMIVLFRRRADVLFASSYCSEKGVEHRIRMSEMPIVIRPWIGWLFGEVVQPIITREEFDSLWDSRIQACPVPFMMEDKESSWALLHHLTAGRRPNTLDLVHFRNIVSRPRPPIELCYPEVGTHGPILGTIHSSKGREADRVVLVMPTHHEEQGSEDAATIFEEGRVYYVGATRARKMLVTAGGSEAKVGYLESNRVYRLHGQMKSQLEIGREGDVDRVSHLSWDSNLKIQQILAANVGAQVRLTSKALPEHDYAQRLFLHHRSQDGVTQITEVGQLSESFQYDLGRLWSKVDRDQRLKPADMIPHLYLACVGTVGLTEAERGSVKPPFNRSGIGLMPIIKGFPMINFLHRNRRMFR
jgi:hypothetical protein